MKNKSCKAFCVVKYKPEYYSEEGTYTKNEWICYSDIGKSFDGEILTFEEYTRVENAYINSVMCMVAAVKATKFKVFNLYKFSEEKNFRKRNDDFLLDTYNLIATKKEYNIENMLANVIKIALRKYALLDIELDDVYKSRVFFGDDYYMYFDSKYNLLLLYNKIKRLGLHPRLR